MNAKIEKSIQEALDKRAEGYVIDIHLLANIIADEAKRDVYNYVISKLVQK